MEARCLRAEYDAHNPGLLLDLVCFQTHTVSIGDTMLIELAFFWMRI
jgi:hypothetical protein